MVRAAVATIMPGDTIVAGSEPKLTDVSSLDALAGVVIVSNSWSWPAGGISSNDLQH